MFWKNNIWISSKSSLKWTWRKRWCSSTSNTFNLPNIDENLSSFKKLKYPESMFVHDNNVASIYQHTNIILFTICIHMLYSSIECTSSSK